MKSSRERVSFPRTKAWNKLLPGLRLPHIKPNLHLEMIVQLSFGTTDLFDR